MLVHSVILPIELKNANTGRTRHFGGSNRERKQYARLLKTLGTDASRLRFKPMWW